MLTLYSHPMSPCAQKVRMVLVEKGLTYEVRQMDMPNKENLQDWYLKLNPLGVIPTLVHDGHPVIESSLICEYLEEAFPERPMRSDDPLTRAKMRLWMKHVDGKLHPSCGALQWPLVVRGRLLEMPEDKALSMIARVVDKSRRERQLRLYRQGLDAPDVVDAVQVYAHTIADMETLLAGATWMLGDTFNLTDCVLAPYFQTLLQYGWLDMFLADRPNVRRWFDQVQQRKGWQEGIAADFSDEKRAELAETGAANRTKVQQHLA